MSQGITPERARSHFTLSEKDAAGGGIFIKKNAPEVDDDWDDGDEGPVDDPDPGYDGHGDKRTAAKK